MDDIKDKSGADPVFDTTPVEPASHPLHEVHPESERRGGTEAGENDADPPAGVPSEH